MAISDEITRLQNAKSQIKTAIENKGVTVPEGTTLDGYSPLINEIKTQGEYQSKSVVPSKDYQLIKPDEGYDALSSVLVAETPLEEKTVDPTTAGLIVEPEGDNIGLSKVTVMGDYNLTSSNIKNGVTIFGVTGTFEGSGGGGSGTTSDLSSVGSTISVEARTTIDKGDRIVGIKNDDYVTPTLGSTPLGISLQILSADESVGIGGGTVQAGFIIPIYFKNETGTYDAYGLEITDLGGITYSNGFIINEDGTRAVTSNGANVLILTIDKTNKSATYSYTTVNISNVPIQGTSYEARITNPSISTSRSGILVSDYLICESKAYVTKVADGSTRGTQNILTIYKCNNSSLSLIYNEGIPTGTSQSYNTFSILDGNGVRIGDEILFGARKYSGAARLGRYSIASNTVSIAEISTSATLGNYLSKNGEYFCVSNANTSVLYSVNLTGLSVNQIKTFTSFTNQATFPNNDGNLVVNSKGVYNVKSDTKLYGGAVPVNKFFDEKRWISSGAIYSVTPSTTAEYLISSIFTFEMVADRIYGIADKSMTVGTQGTARGLFNTF